MAFQKKEFYYTDDFFKQFTSWKGVKVNGTLDYLTSIQEQIFDNMNIVEMITNGSDYAILGL